MTLRRRSGHHRPFVGRRTRNTEYRGNARQERNAHSECSGGGIGGVRYDSDPVRRGHGGSARLGELLLGGGERLHRRPIGGRGRGGFSRSASGISARPWGGPAGLAAGAREDLSVGGRIRV